MIACDGEWFSLSSTTTCRVLKGIACPCPFTTHAQMQCDRYAYCLTFRPCTITIIRLHLLITARFVRLISNSPRSSRSHLFWYLPLGHIHYLFSRSNGRSFSFIQPIHSPCSPCHLTSPCARRTKVTGLLVPVTVAPQQPHLIDSMVEEENDRAWARNCI